MPNNIQEYKIPTDHSGEEDYKNEIEPEAFQLIGGTEEGEMEYANQGTLVNKKNVKNATTAYKNRKIGRFAIFSSKDKMAA